MKRYMVVCLASVLALLMTACGERSLVKKDLAAKAAAIGDGLDMEQVLSGCADRLTAGSGRPWSSCMRICRWGMWLTTVRSCIWTG